MVTWVYVDLDFQVMKVQLADICPCIPLFLFSDCACLRVVDQMVICGWHFPRFWRCLV